MTNPPPPPHVALSIPQPARIQTTQVSSPPPQTVTGQHDPMQTSLIQNTQVQNESPEDTKNHMQTSPIQNYQTQLSSPQDTVNITTKTRTTQHDNINRNEPMQVGSTTYLKDEIPVCHS